MLTDMEISTIVSDLMRLKPQGPKGTKLTYTCIKLWDEDTDRYQIDYKPSLDRWGYSDVTLFSLGLHTAHDVTQYIRKRDFENMSSWRLGRKKSTLTRRSNKIWKKLQKHIVSIQNTGAPGIYRIQDDSICKSYGHIYAETLHEARQNAELFFGYLTKANRLHTSFIKIGTIYDLAALNECSKKDIEGDIKRIHDNIERSKEVLESLNSRLSTLRIVEGQQIYAETAHQSEALALTLDK